MLKEKKIGLSVQPPTQSVIIIYLQFLVQHSFLNKKHDFQQG